MDKRQITFNTLTKTVLDLINMHKMHQINLEPSFQRNSVWKERDRANLIDSMLRGYPIPAVFLYARDQNGKTIYDVIDGKQRLESIYKFTRHMRGTFSVKTQLPGSDEVRLLNWPQLQKNGLAGDIEKFQLSVIQVDGDLGDIINLFVRINSTGKPLTAQEKRKAKYSNSPLLKKATRIASKFHKYFLDHGILSASQIARMKHVELVCELMLSAEKGDPLNKKSALDRVMDSKNMTSAQITRAEKIVVSGLKLVPRMLPSIKATRFKKISDFYSLCLLLIRFKNEGLVLNNAKFNKLAAELLTAFSTAVDGVAEKQKRAQGSDSGNETYREYLLTVLQATDEVKQRRKREKILDDLLRSLFTVRDEQRLFSAIQRRIIWNSDDRKRCTHAGCDETLTWENFTIDHIISHSRGGRSHLSNAAILCRKHNSAKGNKSRSPRYEAA